MKVISGLMLVIIMVIIYLIPAFFWIVVILTTLLTAIFAVLESVSTGQRKFEIRGEEFIRTVKATSPRFFIFRIFGLHFFGWRFLNHGVKTFDINTDKENPNPDKSKSETWKISGGTPREVNSLWEKIPRILVIKNVELGDDTLQVDLGVPIVLTVSDVVLDVSEGLDGGGRFVFKYNADFTLPEAIIKAAVIKRVADQCKSYKALVEADASLLNELMSDRVLAADLLEFGFNLTLIKIDNIATDQAIEEVARQKTLALAQKEVTRINAEAEAEAILLVAKAKAEGLTLEEIAKSKPLIDLINTQYPKATEEERLKMIEKVLSKKALGGTDSKITTLITDLF